MSIQNAILGLLSCQPATGYELKKQFEQSSILYWSGNNNQIYKALLALEEEALVSYDVVHQEGAPSKKVYNLTPAGRKELVRWVKTTPELPECRKPFLIQLRWAHLLSPTQLGNLLDTYITEVEAQQLAEEEQMRRQTLDRPVSGFEALLSQQISKNMMSSWTLELNWAKELKETLVHYNPEQQGNSNEVEKKMDIRSISRNSTTYVEVLSAEPLISSEQDALDLVAICHEQDTQLLLIRDTTLSPAFFDLRTKSAGNILQKFTNYQVRVAFIVPEEHLKKGVFSKMATEANKGRQFLFTTHSDDAERWLTI